MKVVLMHGKDVGPNDKWYPWLAEEMKKRDIEYISPILPNPADPKIDEWLTELDETNPDEETVLVGHSRGGVAILRWLEKQSEKKLRAREIADALVGALKIDDRGFIPEFSVFATNPF